MCSSFYGGVAPSDGCASLHLLETLRVVTGEFVGVYCVAASVGFTAASSSTMILAMRSLKLLLASFVLATLLIACSTATSTSSSHSDSDSYSPKSFSFPLCGGVVFGGSYSLSSSPADSSSSPPLLFLTLSWTDWWGYSRFSSFGLSLLYSLVF